MHLGHLLHPPCSPDAPDRPGHLTAPGRPQLPASSAHLTRLSGHENLSLQEEGFILEILCLCLSGLAGTLGCVCSRTFDRALQGKGELTTRRGEAREDHFLQIGRQEASFQKRQVFSVPPHPLDTPPPGKVCASARGPELARGLPVCLRPAGPRSPAVPTLPPPLALASPPSATSWTSSNLLHKTKQPPHTCACSPAAMDTQGGLVPFSSSRYCRQASLPSDQERSGVGTCNPFPFPDRRAG